MPPRRPRGIRQRVVLLAVLGALAPTLLALAALRSAFGDVARHLREEHQGLARSLALHFDRDVRDTQSDLLAAIGTPEDWASGRSRRSLRATLLRSPILEAIVVIGQGSDGVPQVLWQELRHGVAPTSALLGLAEIDTAFAQGRQGVARLATGDRFAFVVPVQDGNGLVMGVVAAIADPACPPWLSVLRQGALGSGSASLLDEQGRALINVGGATSAVATAGDILATGKLSAVPWQVRLRQPRGEALGPLETQRTRLLVIAPLLLVFVVLFSWGATHSVTEPLKALNRAAQRIADGDLQAPVPPQANDEVGQLGRSLETMRVALKKSVDDLTSGREALEQRVADRTRELRMLLSKFVSAQEDERRRIARELHDETCQTVAALGMKLDVAAAAPSPEQTCERLKEARAFASRALAEVHALIYELRPAVLDDLGLFPAVRWLADHHLTPAGIDYRCDVSVPERNLSPEQQTTLFRAIQEAIRNVARHSGATQVLIQAEQQEAELVVEIEDDGHGFDPESASIPGPSGRGLGLLGLRERMSIIGGSVEIISSAEAGTRVVLRTPFEEEQRRG
jgi:signal transduction histidine kinase